MNAPVATSLRRKVYCVLSSRSLPYAVKALESLTTNSLDDLDVTLITDAAADKVALVDAMNALGVPPRHAWRVCAQAEADERALTVLARYPNIAAFRFGHPCWRKITDRLCSVSASPATRRLLPPPALPPNPMMSARLVNAAYCGPALGKNIRLSRDSSLSISASSWGVMCLRTSL